MLCTCCHARSGTADRTYMWLGTPTPTEELCWPACTSQQQLGGRSGPYARLRSLHARARLQLPVSALAAHSWPAACSGCKAQQHMVKVMMTCCSRSKASCVLGSHGRWQTAPFSFSPLSPQKTPLHSLYCLPQVPDVFLNYLPGALM